jgi:hypothetical protein
MSSKLEEKKNSVTFKMGSQNTVLFFPINAFDIDHHHWLVLGEAIFGEEVG